MNELLNELLYDDILHPEYQQRSRTKLMARLKDNPQTLSFYAGDMGINVITLRNFLKGKRSSFKSMQIIDRWLEGK